jgi:hypothetical protein
MKNSILGTLLLTILPLDALASESPDISITDVRNSCKAAGVSTKRCDDIIKGLPGQKSAGEKKSSGIATRLKLNTTEPPLPPNFSTLMKDEVNTWGCQPVKKALFVRSDPLDNFNYVEALPSPSKSSDSSANPDDSSGQSPNSQTKGASVSYTDDLQARTEKAVINGRLSYVLFGVNSCSFLASPATLHHRNPVTGEITNTP